MGTIPSYPALSRALDGSESVPVWQDGAQVAPTTGQVAAFVMEGVTPAINSALVPIESDITTLQGQVDLLLYVSPHIASFTANGEAPHYAEIGETVDSLTLARTLTGATPTGQSLTWTGGGAALWPVTDAAKPLTGLGLTGTTTFALAITDAGAPAGAGGNDSATVRLIFAQKGHAGIIDKSSGITSADVNGMGQSWFAVGVARTIPTTVGAAGFLWFSQPASLPDPSGFRIGPNSITASKSSRSHITTQGQTVAYNDFLVSDRLSAGQSLILEVVA